MSRERSDELIENLGAGLGHRRIKHTTADGLKLGQFTRQAGVEFQDTRSFIKPGEPIFGARSAIRWSQNGDYFRLVPLQILENGRLRRGGCLQHQIIAIRPYVHP